MKLQGIFTGIIPVLEKVLDLRSMKHNSIVSNIANMDTPNYKTFDFNKKPLKLMFSTSLAKLIRNVWQKLYLNH